MRTAPESSALGTNPRTADLGDERPIFGAVAARGKDHGARQVQVGQAGGDLEPVEIRQLDVEQHQIGLQLLRRSDCCMTVAGLTDHVEALGLEQAAAR